MEVAEVRWRVATAFAIVYLVWGSTYLFMRSAVETIPPLLVSGIRFATAGVLLYLLAHSVRKPEQRKVPWKGHALPGTSLTAGNASVAIAVRLIPSGVASLLVALTPCLMVVLEWYRTRLRVPRLTLLLGLALGICGAVVLVGPQGLAGILIVAAVVLVILGEGGRKTTADSLESANPLAVEEAP